MKRYIFLLLLVTGVVSGCTSGITIVNNPVPSPVPEGDPYVPDGESPGDVAVHENLASIAKSKLDETPLWEGNVYSALFDTDGNTVNVLKEGTAQETLAYQISDDGEISTSGGEQFEIRGKLHPADDGSYYLTIDILFFDPETLTAIAEASLYSIKKNHNVDSEEENSKNDDGCGDTYSEQFTNCADKPIDIDKNNPPTPSFKKPFSG